jgi:hypothetical protein
MSPRDGRTVPGVPQLVETREAPNLELHRSSSQRAMSPTCDPTRYRSSARLQSWPSNVSTSSVCTLPKLSEEARKPSRYTQAWISLSEPHFFDMCREMSWCCLVWRPAGGNKSGPRRVRKTRSTPPMRSHFVLQLLPRRTRGIALSRSARHSELAASAVGEGASAWWKHRYRIRI